MRPRTTSALLAAPLLAMLGCSSMQRLPGEEARALTARRAAVFVGAESVDLVVGETSFDYHATIARPGSLSLGTAFAVTDDGHLLTAAHIFDRPGGTICVYLFNLDGQPGAFVPADLLHLDLVSDVAVLKVSAATSLPFTLAEAPPAVGSMVVSTGTSRGSQRGEVFKVSAREGARARLKFARDTKIGDSGGAVLDVAGSATGVIVEGGYAWHGGRIEHIGVATVVDTAWWALVQPSFAPNPRYPSATQTAGACRLNIGSS